MLYNLERFLKPFRLLLAFNIMEKGGSGKVPVTKEPVSTPATIAEEIQVTESSTVTTQSTTPATSTGAEGDVRVSWVYGLQRTQLEAELAKYGAPTVGTVQQMRADLVSLIRQGKGYAATTDTRAIEETASKMELEAANVREILDLPPSASFAEVRRLLTELRVSRQPGAQGLPAPALRGPALTGPEAQERSESRETPNLSPEMKMDIMYPTAPQARAPDYQVSRSGYVSQQHDRHVNVSPRHVQDDRRDSRMSRSNSKEDDRFSNIAALCNVVRKWNLRFDGKRDNDAISFVERLHELMESYEIEPDRMLKALPELFKDTALLWYRNTREFWAGFSDFLRDFQNQFFPSGYIRHLDDEVRTRTQGEGEVFRQYVVALSTLIRRRGGYSESQKLDRIYMNMHPSYKLYVRRRDFVNLAGLIKVADEYECNLRERLNYRPPPNPAQALVPETAFQGKGKSNLKASFNTSLVMDPGSDVMVVEKRVDQRDVSHKKGPNRNDRDQGTIRGREERQTRRWEPRSGSRTRQDSSSGDRRVPPKICWNCETIGHLYKDCRKPRILKCFNCKKPGVRTTTCDCLKQGNESRTTEQGGRRSPELEPTPRPPTPN